MAILIYGLHLGGRSRMVAQLANGLSARGHEVRMVLLQGQPILYPLRVPVSYVTQFGPKTIPETDVIIATSFGLITPALASGKGRTIRFCSEFEPDQVADFQGVFDLYCRSIPTLTVSKPLADRIGQMSGSACCVANPGVDGCVFHPAGRPAPGGVRRIGYVYRPEALGYGYKANGDFWQVMQQVMALQANLEVAILAPDAMDVVGPIPFVLVQAQTDQQLADFYRSVDIYVSTSHSEGYSLTALEAMACGTVAVLTDSGGIRDYATAGENCFMGVAGDVAMITSLVMAALLHPEMVATLVAGGLTTARARTWDRFIDQAEQGLKALAYGGAP